MEIYYSKNLKEKFSGLRYKIPVEEDGLVGFERWLFVNLEFKSEKEFRSILYFSKKTFISCKNSLSFTKKKMNINKVKVKNIEIRNQ